jgi:transcriptional regulator GlxA family with amidase domain
MPMCVDFLPLRWQADDMLRNVATIALPGLNPFELGVACEGFGLDRSDDGLANYDFAVVSLDDSPVPTSAGWSLTTPYRLDRAREADLVIVPAVGSLQPPYPAEVLELLRETIDRGARVMSICSGVFVLGAAGLLDGRRCTTHWRYTNDLAAQYPKAIVDADVLYVEDGPILTSAGTAAGLDLCLHVIRSEHGPAAANIVARRMVMPPHRDGGQAQYVTSPIRPLTAASETSMDVLLMELMSELDTQHTVESLAHRMLLSPRTFARRFRAETGTTPYAWLLRQRVLTAQSLLEGSDESMEGVARRTGFGTATMMRHHFSRVVGTSPAAYRRTFRPHL